MENHDVQLHERMASVETNLEQIKSNHLPHLQAAIDKINDKLWWIISSLILGIVMNGVLMFFKK